jgi:putative ABC transport system substrate-binding protein
MRRREFISFFGGAAITWPLTAKAQLTKRVPLVGVLYAYGATSEDGKSYDEALDAGFREAGWIPGQAIRIERRWTDFQLDRYPTLAKELVSLAPDVLIATTTATLRALAHETQSIPIVFTQVSDPVSQGFVTSLAHPGANITGFSIYEFGIGSKWLGLLREADPRIKRILFLSNPDTSPQAKFFKRSIEAAASSSGIALAAAEVHAAEDIEPAITTFGREPSGGLIIGTDNFLSNHAEQIVNLAMRLKLPSIFALERFAIAGGLMSYSADPTANFRRAAMYVLRILKGEKAGDLPIEAPTKFRFVLNLKTAKALALPVPPGLIAIADEVIE